MKCRIGLALFLLPLGVGLVGGQEDGDVEARSKNEKWTLRERVWDFSKVSSTFKVISGRFDPTGNQSTWVLENLKDNLGALNTVTGTPFKVAFLDADKTQIEGEANVKMAKIGSKAGERFRLTVIMPNEKVFRNVRSVQVNSRTSLVN